jgi:hypothetical protein
MSLKDTDDVAEDGNEEGPSTTDSRKSVSEAVEFLQKLKQRLLGVIQEACGAGSGTGEETTPKLTICFDEIDVMKVERRRNGRPREDNHHGVNSVAELKVDGKSDPLSGNGGLIGDASQRERMAHVLYVGPSKDWEGYERVKRICGVSIRSCEPLDDANRVV